MRIVVLLSLLLLVTGCVAGPVVQAFTEPYSVEASVTVTDETGAAVTKGAWLNSRFVAIDLGASSAQFVLRGPRVYGGPIEELRRFSADTDGGGRKAWAIVLPSKSGEETRLVPSTWEAARVSIPAMPE